MQNQWESARARGDCHSSTGVLCAFGEAVVDVRTQRVQEIRRNEATRTQDQRQLLRSGGAAWT